MWRSAFKKHFEHSHLTTFRILLKTLFLTCTESLPNYPDHPVLSPGTTVQIGLDKPVKLCEVFKRYVDFCNEQYPSQKVDVNDLEFYHTQLLNGHDTAEVAALMKNDRISVRREQSNERLDEEVWNRLQREIDQLYFRQLRDMIPIAEYNFTSLPDFADVVLDCRHSLIPDSVSSIYCHSFMICKRCPWLNRMILAARQEQARSSVVTLPNIKGVEDDDHSVELVHHNKIDLPDVSLMAAKIENDDEDLNEGNSLAAQTQNASNILWIEINDHPPEAIKILLEYCYTNRVENVGYEAFLHSCRTKPQYKKMQGPVPPFSQRRWPNNGEPTITFDVAIAGIRLAEEANMPRLSLMCEIAAAQLVDHSNAVDALVLCEEQRQLSGNALSRLRKATMELVLISYQLGNDNLASLKDALKTKSSLLIPPLITGTMEAVEAGEKRMRHLNVSSMHFTEKRDWQTIIRPYFEKIDSLDAKARERERRKRRMGVDFNDDYIESNDDRYDEYFSFWGETGVRHFSLKRMHGHGTASSILGNQMAARRSGTLSNHLLVTSKRNNPPLPRRDLR